VLLECKKSLTIARTQEGGLQDLLGSVLDQSEQETAVVCSNNHNGTLKTQRRYLVYCTPKYFVVEGRRLPEACAINIFISSANLPSPVIGLP
jgi:hypothetical protein